MRRGGGQFKLKGPYRGVATFFQGTVVQGDLGPRGKMSKGPLPKEILVQGDFSPRESMKVQEGPLVHVIVPGYPKSCYRSLKGPRKCIM